MIRVLADFNTLTADNKKIRLHELFLPKELELGDKLLVYDEELEVEVTLDRELLVHEGGVTELYYGIIDWNTLRRL